MRTPTLCHLKGGDGAAARRVQHLADTAPPRPLPDTSSYPSLLRPKCGGSVATRRVGRLAAPHTPKGRANARSSRAAPNAELELATRRIGRLTSASHIHVHQKEEFAHAQVVPLELRRDESDISLTPSAPSLTPSHPSAPQHVPVPQFAPPETRRQRSDTTSRTSRRTSHTERKN